MKAKQRPPVPWALAATAASGLLAACQSAPPQRAEAPLPAEIAQRLETVRQERTDFPEFSDVPAPPTDVRTPEQWRLFVERNEGAADGLQGWTRQNPAWITDTQGHVASARAALRDAGPPPPPDQRAQTEAFAQRMRELARPPAPPQ